MGIKSKGIMLVLLCAILLSGCGSSGGGYATSTMSNMKAESAVAGGSGFYNGVDSYAEVEYEVDDSFGGYDYDNDYTYDESYEQPAVEEPELAEQEQDVISKDMLIYRGNISITTKDFDADLKLLKSTLNAFDCFFEDERMWSNQGYDDRNMHNYTATIRVKSNQYESLINGLNDIGTVTNLSSSCENVSSEYTDTIVAIDIYEAERERYVNMLKTIMDDQYAIQVQRELTDIELKLAQFRARKKNIETDVAYSYVTVDLTEVREYVQQVEHNDSFLTRLWREVVNTVLSVLNFFEYLLFTAIRIAPYILLLWIVFNLSRRSKLARYVGRFKVIQFIRGTVADIVEGMEEDKERRKATRKWVDEMNNTIHSASTEGEENVDASEMAGEYMKEHDSKSDDVKEEDK